MPWNWEIPDWPKFSYDPSQIREQEKEFLLSAGKAGAFFKTISKEEEIQFIVEILSDEGTESAKIEREILDRASLQSSIRKHFGLHTKLKRGADREIGMSEVLCDVYDSFERPLTHDMLFRWHEMLFKGDTHIEDLGQYRTHPEPMQIVGGRRHEVFFEAPPSKIIPKEMEKFITWFNKADRSSSILGKAAIAHLYFESIHPFEDGNGRIGRILIEKILSQAISRPTLMAISKTLEKRKKEYYAALEACNHTLEVDSWIAFFAEVVLQAQQESLVLLQFLIKKAKMLTSLAGQINPRQEKVLLRMFAEGPSGFKGGLRAENYIAITKASRPTATRDLADLVTLGALKKTGTLRHTRYWLNLRDEG